MLWVAEEQGGNGSGVGGRGRPPTLISTPTSSTSSARGVVRNGRHEPRQVLTSSGAIEVVAPRVNDKRTEEATGARRWFASAILAPWCRKVAQDHRGVVAVVPERVVLVGIRAGVGAVLWPGLVRAGARFDKGNPASVTPPRTTLNRTNQQSRQPDQEFRSTGIDNCSNQKES